MTYTNEDGTPKGPFVTGQQVRVIVRGDPETGRTHQVAKVRGDAVWLAVPHHPVPLHYWAFEIEAVA